MGAKYTQPASPAKAPGHCSWGPGAGLAHWQVWMGHGTRARELPRDGDGERRRGSARQGTGRGSAEAEPRAL